MPAYSFSVSARWPSSRVAFSTPTTSTPVAIGSSVPACPTRRVPASRRTRATTSCEVRPAGLSTMSRPLVRGHRAPAARAAPPSRRPPCRPAVNPAARRWPPPPSAWQARPTSTRPFDRVDTSQIPSSASLSTTATSASSVRRSTSMTGSTDVQRHRGPVPVGPADRRPDQAEPGGRLRLQHGPAQDRGQQPEVAERGPVEQLAGHGAGVNAGTDAARRPAGGPAAWWRT